MSTKISKNASDGSRTAHTSGCVTWAFLYRSAMGRMKRSYFTGRLVKSGPTKVCWCQQTSAPACQAQGVPVLDSRESVFLHHTQRNPRLRHDSLVIIRFQLFLLVFHAVSSWGKSVNSRIGQSPTFFPVCMTLKASSSLMPRTLGSGLRFDLVSSLL